jgi:hypothetical protein
MIHAATSDRFLHILRLGGIILVIVLAVALLGGSAFGWYVTYRAEHSPNQPLFKRGKPPESAPNGFYQGNRFSGLGEGWQGKIFNSAEQTGINKFADGERYRFKTFVARGLRDRKQEVLRIDYNQSGNPWWLRFIVDEVVETTPGHYLGKVHLKLIPGLPFTLSYFELANTSET